MKSTSASFRPPQARRPPVSRLVDAAGTYTIRMTAGMVSITTLRRLAMPVCGEALEYMRIAMCAGGSRMRVWLCVRLPVVALLSATIARQVPGAFILPAGGGAESA